MEEGAKRRLVGAAVIVALLVIFLPMLVEEEEPAQVPEEALVVPPRPVVEARPEAVPAAGLTAEEAQIVPPPGATELAPPPLYVPPVAEEPQPAQEQSWSRVPIAEPSPPAREPAKAPAPAKPAAESVKPVPGARPSGPSAWVAQVAALTEQPRAQALERELRGKGFPAFIETVRIDDKTFHRVRVGPESDRKRIDALAARLKEQGLQPQVVRYP